MQARLLPCIVLLIFAPMLAVAQDAPEKHWQKVMSGERKVGYVEHTRRVADGRVFSSEVMTLELATSATRQTYVARLETESTSDGALLRLIRESKTPEGHTLIDARRTGENELTVVIGTGAGKHTQLLPNTGPLRSGEAARAWLKAAGAGAAQEPLSYQTFDPNRLGIVEVRLERVDTATPPVRVRRVLRGGDRATVALLTLNENGEVIDETMRLGATTLRLTGSTEGEARARGERLNHVAAQMQKSPYRIPGRDMRAKIRFGFDHHGKPKQLPVGGGQRSWSDAQTTWIQVCASCPLDVEQLGDAERARTLAATPWFNFEDVALSRRARRLAGGTSQPDRKMQRLTAFVRGHMTAKEIDMLGYGTALEAYQSRRGDCTEYAVLLAAMGRAAGVPTRVVSGLVYARHFENQRHVFVPHAWVHAWTGEGWESFDAALGHFDSTHLAFAASDDGNPARLFAGISLAHEWQLRSAARVVPRPPAAN